MLNRKRQDRHERSERKYTNSHDTSLIAHGTVIRGDLRFSGALHLDGRIEGSVLAQSDDAVFTLSEHGQVQGEIRVAHAVINGLVQGDIHASEKLELAPLARIIGDVSYRTLEMTAGAQVNGRMSHLIEEEVEEIQRELPAPAELDDAVPA